MNAPNNEYIDFKYIEGHDRDEFIYLLNLQICDLVVTLKLLCKKKKQLIPICKVHETSHKVVA